MTRTRMTATALIGAAAIALGATPAAAQTYRWTDRDGVIRYTDRPPRPEEVAPTTPTAPAPSASATIAELMEASGLGQQLQWVASSTRAQIQSRLGVLDADERAAVDRAVAAAFSPSRLHALVDEVLAPRLVGTNAGRVLGWYRASIGRKIVSAETVAAMPEAEQQLAAFAKRRAGRPAERARLERLRRLDVAAGTSEFTFDIVVAVTQGVRRGIEPFLPVDRQRALAAAERDLADTRERAVEQLRTALLVNHDFIYRDIDDAELDAYLEFLTSPDGRWFTGEIHRALLHAVRVSTEEAIVAIAAVVPPHLWGKARPARPAPAPKI